jgi:molybdopterin-containing oxidoreductase family membrane subunit
MEPLKRNTLAERALEPLVRFAGFVLGSARVVVRGNAGYWAWIGFLLLLILIGLGAYANQTAQGLITSNMRDQVSWGFYIGSFAFFVGVAAAAVVLVIPAYVYQWGPIKEVVLIGELMAVSAIVICLLFVTVDLGRPDRLWHMFPGLGAPNFPYSLLVWDVLVLNSYFAINYFIVTYLLYMAYTNRPYNPNFIMPLIFLSIPLAILIHTVTAFLFMGLVARPYWHIAILAPRFISSAFCSGPALLVLIYQAMRRFGTLHISDTALTKIGELLAYTMAVNLFFLGSEVFNEFYFPVGHSAHGHFQWFGTPERMDIAIYTWVALALNSTAFVIFVIPQLRTRLRLLSAGCALAATGVFIEKGLGLLLPGMTPDTLGEIYPYNPSLNELLVGAGVLAVGALTFTLMSKVALAIDLGELREARS